MYFQAKHFPTTLIFSLLFLLSLFCPLQASAVDPPPSPDRMALELQELYGNLSSLAFDFEQVTRTGGRERIGRGDAVFYKTKGRSVMRWNYTEPDRQVIINDGTTLSIYTESDHQLIRTPAAEIESDITYAFFAGTRSLLDDFTAQIPDSDFTFSTAEPMQTLLLTPRKPHNQIRDIQVWFDAGNIIRYMMIRDHFDSVTELNFNHIKLNSLPPDDPAEITKITTLEIPPETEVITR